MFVGSGDGLMVLHVVVDMLCPGPFPFLLPCAQPFTCALLPAACFFLGCPSSLPTPPTALCMCLCHLTPICMPALPCLTPTPTLPPHLPQPCPFSPTCLHHATHHICLPFALCHAFFTRLAHLACICLLPLRPCTPCLFLTFFFFFPCPLVTPHQRLCLFYTPHHAAATTTSRTGRRTYCSRVPRTLPQHYRLLLLRDMVRSMAVRLLALLNLLRYRALLPTLLPYLHTPAAHAHLWTLFCLATNVRCRHYARARFRRDRRWRFLVA